MLLATPLMLCDLRRPPVYSRTVGKRIGTPGWWRAFAASLLCAAGVLSVFAPTGNAATARPCKGLNPNFNDQALRHNVAAAKCQVNDIVLVAEPLFADDAKGNQALCVGDSQKNPPDYSDTDAVAGLVGESASKLKVDNEALHKDNKYFATFSQLELTQLKFDTDAGRDNVLLSKVIEKSEKFDEDLKQESEDLSSHDCQEVQRSADFLELHSLDAKNVASKFLAKAAP